jgi:hypothetical protein
VIAMRTSRGVAVITAALLLTGGYVHLCLYRRGYRAIPTIGVAFLLQVIASVAVAMVVLVGPRALARVTRLTEVATAAALHIAALALGAGTLVAFAMTRTPEGLFNFREVGLQPAPQALIALLAESAIVLVSGAGLVADHVRSHRGPSLVRPV